MVSIYMTIGPLVFIRGYACAMIVHTRTDQHLLQPFDGAI